MDSLSFNSLSNDAIHRVSSRDDKLALQCIRDMFSLIGECYQKVIFNSPNYGKADEVIADVKPYFVKAAALHERAKKVTLGKTAFVDNASSSYLFETARKIPRVNQVRYDSNAIGNFRGTLGGMKGRDYIITVPSQHNMHIKIVDDAKAGTEWMSIPGKLTRNGTSMHSGSTTVKLGFEPCIEAAHPLGVLLHLCNPNSFKEADDDAVLVKIWTADSWYYIDEDYQYAIWTKGGLHYPYYSGSTGYPGGVSDPPGLVAWALQTNWTASESVTSAVLPDFDKIWCQPSIDQSGSDITYSSMATVVTSKRNTIANMLGCSDVLGLCQRIADNVNDIWDYIAWRDSMIATLISSMDLNEDKRKEAVAKASRSSALALSTIDLMGLISDNSFNEIFSYLSGDNDTDLNNP